MGDVTAPVGLFAVGCGLLVASWTCEEIRHNGWRAWWSKGTDRTGPQ